MLCSTPSACVIWPPVFICHQGTVNCSCALTILLLLLCQISALGHEMNVRWPSWSLRLQWPLTPLALSLSLASLSLARPPGEVIHVRAMTSLSVAVVVVAASACHHAAYAFRFMCVRVCTLHMFSSQGPFIYCITRLDFDPISLACCLNKFRHAPSPCTSATSSAFASATK